MSQRKGMIIEELRLYKMNGDFLRFEMSDETNRGKITSIVQLPSGWFEVRYDDGKRFASFSGFNGCSILYGPEVI